MEKKLELVQKIEKYSLYVGIIGIFVSIGLPWFGYVSTGAFALTYILAMVKTYLKNGHIKLLTFLLGTASLAWVVLRQFMNSPYVTFFGQIVLYSYLLNTQWEVLGKINKKFAIFVSCAVIVGGLNVFYPSKGTNILNMGMQLWILYKFLDPILEKIGQAHRKKRLAEEAKRKENEQKGQEEENLEWKATMSQI